MTSSPPIRVLVPGNVYRRDFFDPSHAPMFAQIEGLAIDEGIAFVDLKATLSRFAERYIDAVLHDCRMAAQQRGALPNDSGEEAGLFPDVVNHVSVVQIRANLVKQLVGRGEESVIVAVVPANAFGRGFVPITIQLFDNPIVIKGGELLGEIRLDSGLSVGRIFEEIGTMLREQVRKIAENRKMIPISGRDDAYGTLPGRRTGHRRCALMHRIRSGLWRAEPPVR